MIDHLLLNRRVDGQEMLDEKLGSAAEARRSLEDLRRLNHYLFGVRQTLSPLKQWLRETPKPATVLDIGTGSGQLAQALHRWAAREYQAVEIVALDRLPRHLQVAATWNVVSATPHVALVAGDALALPLADGSVDYVISSLFLHHFDETGLQQLFEECLRVARRGVVMSDLWRHPLPFYLYKLLAEPIFVHSPITRVDSSISFRRAYRPEEIRRIAATVLPEVQVSLHLPSFRWALVGRWG